MTNAWFTTILPASLVAAALVAFFTWRQTWRHEVAVATDPAPSSRAEDDDDRLDELLAQSFPASDPPSWTTGIARVGQAPLT